MDGLLHSLFLQYPTKKIIHWTLIGCGVVTGAMLYLYSPFCYESSFICAQQQQQTKQEKKSKFECYHI